MTTAAGEIASALVLQDTGKSTPHDALVYLGQSMAFATACSVASCYAAWCCGTKTHDVGLRFFQGEDAQGQPAVYHECCLPTKSLYQESHHIGHLAAVPYGPADVLEFGATPLSSLIITPLWRSNSVVYVLGVVIPPAFAYGSLYRPTTRVAIGYAAFVLLFIVAYTDALTKAWAYYDEHGTIDGVGDLRAALYVIGFFGTVLVLVLPVFGSSHPMSSTVKCKAAGIMFLWSIVAAILTISYQSVFMYMFFSTDSIVAKLLIRSIGMW